MAKFVNLFSKYLPTRMKVAPKGVDLYLSEDLEYTPIIRNRYLSGTLTPDSTEIYYDCSDGVEIFKDKGVVKIEDEYIKYNSIDRTNHKLYDLERGYFDSEIATHCNDILWTAVLSEDIDAYTTIIPFTSITDSAKIPSQGKFAIYTDVNDLEIISYADFNQYISGYQFTNVSRGSGTAAYRHAKDSIIEEYANLLIEQVDSIEYEQGLWSLALESDMTWDDETATITVPFTALLDEELILSDTSIDVSGVTGTVPTQGYILIGTEIIRYGYYTADTSDPSNTLGTFSECIRGQFGTNATSHSSGNTIFFQPPPYGEFLIDDEYIHYSYYVDNEDGTGTFGSENYPLVRGFYGTVADEHSTSTILTERRHTELEAVGIFTIGKEYFKYWSVDDDRFYVDKRPALNAKTYYRTGTGTEFQSIIESHDIGALITTYHFDDENSYLIDFLHSTAEYLDFAISAKADMLEKFSDVDTVDFDYLTYIVKMLGENLEDYQNLPFFAAENYDYRVRLFTKELVNIYKEKGLLSALRLWQKVISEPLESYQDLWTMNYCSFYSLPFLSLLLYDAERNFYPNNENFFRPQISKAIQKEIAEYYENKVVRDPNTAISYPVSSLKLLVHNWDYFAKADDELNTASGRSFDDKIVPCDTQDNLGTYYDRVNVELLVRGTSTTIPFPYYIEDYDVDLFKFEDELDASKNDMPTSETDCLPITTDVGLVSDYEEEWILDESALRIYDYCDLADRLRWIQTDTGVLHNLTSDISNAEIELDHNTTADETSIVVKVTDGKLYDPAEHIESSITPAIAPKGFVKFGNEVISYTGIKFYDAHTGVFTNKRYLLTGCERGVKSTTASAYKPNVYEGNERLLNGRGLEILDDSVTYRLILTRDPRGYEVEVGDSLYLVQADGTYEIYTITNLASEYDYCEETYAFGIDFIPSVSTTPTIGSDVIAPTTHYSCTINEDTDTITCTSHLLSDNDIIYFLKSFSGVNAYQGYYVIVVDANTFQISLTFGGVAIAFANVQDTSNTYLWNGTRIISTEEGYQHRYSLCQHLLWRLDNEVNANDMPLVYGMTTAQLTEKKLDSYKGVGNGIIWPTPHFKYGVNIATTAGGLSNDGVVNLVLKKIKQYKPKHTVADLTIVDPLDSTSACQLDSVVSQENYETEIMRSDIYTRMAGITNSSSSAPADSITCHNHDLHNGEVVYIEGSSSLTFGTPYYAIYVDADTFKVSASRAGSEPFVVPGVAVAIAGTEAVHITQAPESQFRINLYPIIGDPAAKSWELPIITLDEVVDYGASANFSYTWKVGTPDETLVYYDIFEAYPYGLKLDVPYRVRKRFLTHVE
ncbi:MAG: hypothetical protein WC495_05245 [Patescibacteria group bacterium]|jgi:hypothetical protein